jgi:serine/threonine-protein kinase
MAPEQGLGKPVDGRADVYSLAVVLYEMITGNKPFSADTPLAVLMMHVNDPIPSTRKYNVRIPESLERVLYKALAKDAENRYQSMAEFGKALQGVLAEYGQRPEPKPWVNEVAPIAVAVEKAEEPKPKPQASQQRISSPKPTSTPKPVNSKEKHEESRKARVPVIPLVAVLVVLAAAGGWYGINQGRNGNANRTPTAIVFGGAALGSETMTATPSPTSTEFDAGLAILAETSTEKATLTSTFKPTATRTSPPLATNTQAPPSRTSTKTNTFTPSNTFTSSPTIRITTPGSITPSYTFTPQPPTNTPTYPIYPPSTTNTPIPSYTLRPPTPTPD